MEANGDKESNLKTHFYLLLFYKLSSLMLYFAKCPAWHLSDHSAVARKLLALGGSSQSLNLIYLSQDTQ